MHKLFARLQVLLPHHALSRLVHWIMRRKRIPMRRALVNRLVKLYDIDVDEALEPDLHNREVYPTLNSCFTRALKPGARPLPDDHNILVSPADGRLSAMGSISDGRLIQAKGRDYSLRALLGDQQDLIELFKGGDYCTVYLSPRDYHRVHMPSDGTLREMISVPGRLFSVNNASLAAVPNLFTRNERVISLFDTAHGPMAVILVGAIFVGSIETVWAGEVTPPHGKHIQRTSYDTLAPQLARGEEMGRFNLGSTVIVLSAAGRVQWHASWQAGDQIKLGQALGSWHEN